MVASKEMFPALQGLRGLCFLLVFAGHAGSFSWLHAFGMLGAVGVSAFFVLSGFLMMFHYGGMKERLSVMDSFFFAVGRMKRIYGLHVLTTVTVFLVYVFLGGMPAAEYHLPGLPLNLLMLQAWVPDIPRATGLNGVSWYLSAVFFAYGCFPWLSCRIGRLGSRETVACLAGVIGLQIGGALLATVVADGNKELFLYLTYVFPVFRLGDFVTGCLAGHWFKNGGRQLLAGAGRGVIFGSWLAATMLVCASVPFIGTEHSGLWLSAMLNETTAFILPGTVWVLLAAAGRGISCRLLRLGPLVALGNISGPAYLLHSMIILCCNAWLQKENILLPGWQQGMLIAGELATTCLLSRLYMLRQRLAG